MNFSATPCRVDFDTPVGQMTAAANASGLLGVWFAGQAHAPDWAAWPLQPQAAVLAQTVDQLGRYWQGRLRRFDLPLSPQVGTEFQRRVWAALQGIEHGQTLSYGALARRLQHPSGARAVAAAVARNPWSVVVPCHRVLGARGQLTGYAGGLERKAALLALEQRA